MAFARVPREGSHRFGLADIEGDDKMGGKVLDYMEKRKDSSYEWASLTIYVFTPYALFEALQENTGADSHEFGRDIIPWLLSKGYRVYGYRHHGYWGYARTLQEYWQTNMDLLGEPCKVDIGSWGVCTNLAPRGTRDRQPSLVGPSALIEDSLIYSGCSINGTVKHSVLFPGVKVDFGATVEDSILLSSTMIKQDAVVRKTIADEDTTVGVGTRIGEADTENICVIGKGTRLPKGLIIPSGATIYPNTGPARFTRKVYEKGEVIQ
jgi:glucose-1-phosphate adenylyltransferase